MTSYGRRPHWHRPSGHRSPALDVLDRVLDRVGPLQAHRFGHSHDPETGEGEHDDDDILAAIRREAAALHERLAHEHDVFVVEVMGSTGSGKTEILERLIENAPADERIGVIAGDVAGEDDARRFRDLGVDVANVNTGKECHLDPGLVEGTLEDFDLDTLETLYIENVGNMVCPADFPLGAEARVLVVSTTEGEDVVRKHPLLFQSADAAVINKTDIADAVGADVETMASDVETTAPDLPVFQTNAKEGVGIDGIEAYLEDLRGHHHGDGGHEHTHVDSEGDEFTHSHEHTHVDSEGREYTHTHEHTHSGDDDPHAPSHATEPHAHSHDGEPDSGSGEDPDAE